MSVSSALVSFAVLAALVTITPGIDTVMVLRATLAGGRRVGAATAAGIFVGVLAWGVAAAVGVSALLATWVLGYTVLRYAGAAYLLVLGFRLLRAAWRGDHTDPAADPTALALTPARGFRQGLVANLLNPKVGAFYVAAVPHFLPDGVSPLGMGVLLALVHDLEGLVWFAAIILGAHRARRLLAGCRARRAVDATAGTALVAFGLRLGAP